VQKPHPKEFTLEKQHLSSSRAELVKFSYLSLWSTKSDGLVHSQAHFLHPFSDGQRQAIIRSGKRFGNPGVASTTIHLAT
jgi:hypothetical protein